MIWFYSISMLIPFMSSIKRYSNLFGLSNISKTIFYETRLTRSATSYTIPNFTQALMLISHKLRYKRSHTQFAILFAVLVQIVLNGCVWCRVCVCVRARMSRWEHMHAFRNENSYTKESQYSYQCILCERVICSSW